MVGTLTNYLMNDSMGQLSRARLKVVYINWDGNNLLNR